MALAVCSWQVCLVDVFRFPSRQDAVNADYQSCRSSKQLEQRVVDDILETIKIASMCKCFGMRHECRDLIRLTHVFLRHWNSVNVFLNSKFKRIRSSEADTSFH